MVIKFWQRNVFQVMILFNGYENIFYLPRETFRTRNWWRCASIIFFLLTAFEQIVEKGN